MTEPTTTKCLICDEEAASLQDDLDHRRRSRTFSCPRCGTFRVLNQAHDEIKRLKREGYQDLHLLSAISRSHWERRREPFVVDARFRERVSEVPALSVAQKIRNLLRILGHRSAHPGDQVRIDIQTDYPLLFCKNSSEMDFHLRNLDAMGLIKLLASSGGYDCTLTPDGWAAMEEAPPDLLSRSKAFVAMSFAEEMTSVYTKGVKPAIEAAGYDPVRMDLVEHVDRIDDRILAEIRESRFVVAEFTGHRQGVYFEAGFALALGLPVIWVCRKDEKDKAHFDTSHFNHILWETPTELREQLETRIRAVVGLGPRAGRPDDKNVDGTSRNRGD